MKQVALDRRRRKKADKRWEGRAKVKSRLVDQRRRSWGGGEVPSKERVVSMVVREAESKERSRVGTKTVVRNRCVSSGNGRSVRRWFRKSGLVVREMARRGKLEGVFRSSW